MQKIRKAGIILLALCLLLAHPQGRIAAEGEMPMLRDSDDLSHSALPPAETEAPPPSEGELYGEGEPWQGGRTAGETPAGQARSGALGMLVSLGIGALGVLGVYLFAPREEETNKEG